MIYNFPFLLPSIDLYTWHPGLEYTNEPFITFPIGRTKFCAEQLHANRCVYKWKRLALATGHIEGLLPSELVNFSIGSLYTSHCFRIHVLNVIGTYPLDIASFHITHQIYFSDNILVLYLI